MPAIISASYDNYDSVKPACSQSIDTDWVFVTDTVEQARDAEQLGWRVVFEPRPQFHPNRAAKFPKCMPWRYTAETESVWIDASFRVVSDYFAEQALNYAQPIAQFLHPWRDCALEEAHYSAELPKYADCDFSSQIAAYSRHPAHWGLWATGVIARQHTEEIATFGILWLMECLTHTFQDQVSEPVVLHDVGLRPVELPGSHLTNPWLSYEGSVRH